jgi:hypothetical protein
LRFSGQNPCHEYFPKEMSISFKTLPEFETIRITATGHVDSAEVNAMRRRTMELTNATGYSNYIVDLQGLTSIAQGDVFSAYELGDRFRETGLPFHTRTAVIMPFEPAARQQAEFLHTVEVNRGRGDLRYVGDEEEAKAWFRERPGD